VIANHGGMFPVGLFPLVIVTSGVVFAYAAVELVGTAAGETANPEKNHAARDQLGDRPDRPVLCRFAVPVGLLLPYTAYKASESPFVTFFSKIGVGGAGTIMNVVVLTAAFSSLNAGLYSTGSDPAVDGDERQRTEVHVADVRKEGSRMAASASPR